jgi:pyruvate/2-oxoglutarate/acetoin dehydrogenase E1 component
MPWRWRSSFGTSLGQPLSLDRCFVVREGSDVTLIAWGAMLAQTVLAGERLAELGVAAEIIDVATLKPLDTATILASVERTGRVVIVHEAAVSCGFGALVLPDFVVNSGGVICAAVEYHQGSEAQALATIEEKIRTNTLAVLKRAAADGVLPRAAALELAGERVGRAMSFRRTF